MLPRQLENTILNATSSQTDRCIWFLSATNGFERDCVRTLRALEVITVITPIVPIVLHPLLHVIRNLSSIGALRGTTRVWSQQGLVSPSSSARVVHLDLESTQTTAYGLTRPWRQLTFFRSLAEVMVTSTSYRLPISRRRN
ncbi:hypothetical protein RHGRI_027849 [Rhododendron griersonianum]|uniref:Uncharacterized protein n=1 Tax=Rhododendron griersonianum TaxID=479676 RepID=A0AAV6J201_9ERIC|nr:hypothetical protein RHGRI_027849 [Rhododendron griersonianum]